MVFSSLDFLFYFLPVVLGAYFLVPRGRDCRWKNLVLLVFSLLFYAWGEPVYVLLMIFSILMDYGLGLWLEREKTRPGGHPRLVLVVSVALNLALLGFFKYADFLIGTLNSLTGAGIPLFNLPLPIGISFYTFQAMSYLIDLYRGDVEVQRSPLSFGTYVSLFPQLIAGPIVRIRTVSEELRTRRESYEDFASGIKRFTVGLCKKALLANTVGEVWNQVSAMGTEGLPVLTAWIGLAAFTFQIYFDFSGYSDMAIGLGRMFGFHFLENFDYPYISKSITEFWRRWHISLSTWFREYVYIPLGGNRKGLLKQIRNILIVWLLTGIWHGAGWNFVAWGLYFGILLMAEKWFLLRWLDRLPGFVRHVYTMLLVMLGWGLFAFDSLGDGLAYIGALFGGSGGPVWDTQSLYLAYTGAVLLVILILGSTGLPAKLADCVGKRLSRRRPDGRAGYSVVAAAGEMVLVTLGLVLSVAFLVDASYNPFLYFRF
jgi:alginate O-acetyltransferase complex protein AlgI